MPTPSPSTRDAWELTRRGALNGYAAQVMAAAMLLADPSLVEDASTAE